MLTVGEAEYMQMLTCAMEFTINAGWMSIIIYILSFNTNFSHFDHSIPYYMTSATMD